MDALGENKTLKQGFVLGAIILLVLVIYYYMSMGQPKTGTGCGCAGATPPAGPPSTTTTASAFVPAPNVKGYDLGNGIVLDPTGPFNSADQYAVRYSP